MAGPLLLAGIAAGSSLLGTGINAFAQGKINKKTRQWNERMYGLQRRDALSDWERQNVYNSPREQMRRLREAGLNPNLVYGEGASMSNAQSVRSSDTGSWNPRAPEYDIGSAGQSGIGAYYDVRIKEAQLDNLVSTNSVLQQDALLRAAQVIATGASGESTKFDLDLKRELKQISLQAAQANLDKTYQEISKLGAESVLTTNRDMREAAMNSVSIQEALERIMSIQVQRALTENQREHIRAQISSIRKDVELKQLDIDLKRVGVQPGDNMFMRILVRILEKYTRWLK